MNQECIKCSSNDKNELIKIHPISTSFVCCNKCFKNLKLEIICNRCLYKYPSVFRYTKYNQGFSCSSTSNNGLIRCHYGSKYDFSYYIWKETSINYSNICDYCIGELLNESKIVFKSHY